jgi:hypothetical protein
MTAAYADPDLEVGPPALPCRRFPSRVKSGRHVGPDGIVRDVG